MLLLLRLWQWLSLPNLIHAARSATDARWVVWNVSFIALDSLESVAKLSKVQRTRYVPALLISVGI